MQVVDLIECVRGADREIERLTAAKEDYLASIRTLLGLTEAWTVLAGDDPWRVVDGDVRLHSPDASWIPCGETLYSRSPNHGVAVMRGTATVVGVFRYTVDTWVVRPLASEAP